VDPDPGGQKTRGSGGSGFGSGTLVNWLKFFSSPVQKLNNLQFYDICGYKKGRTTIIFSPLYFFAAFVSGKDIKQNTGSRIRDKHRYRIHNTVTGKVIPKICEKKALIFHKYMYPISGACRNVH
jgi:hypothetical protein